MYSIKERIGPSRTGNDGKCRPISVVDMMQDCSQLWMESEPAFESYLTDNGLGMLLAFRQLDIVRLPAYGNTVTVSTSVFECKSYFGYRNTAMYDSNGDPCALSWTVGVFVDMKTGKMARIPQSVLDGLTYDEKIDMYYTPKKIALPEADLESMPEPQIRRSDVDMYNHVNNARIIEIATEVLPADFVIKRLRVEYKRQVKLGDILYSKRLKASNNLYYIILSDSNSQPYVVFEFSS